MNYRYLLAGALSFFSVAAEAQQELTLHLMNNIHQSSRTNPALCPKNNVHISLLSSYQFNAINTGFNYQQVASQTETNEEGERVLNLGTLYKNVDLNGRDYLNVGAAVDIFALSFRSGKGRFSLNVTEHVQARLGYSDAILKLATQGNTPGQTISLDGYWFKGTHYREVGLGYNRKLLEDGKLVVGGRLKGLFGLANVNTERTNLSITTADEADLYALTLTSDMTVQTSGLNSLQNGGASYVANTGNVGFGMDLGATYQYNDKLSFSGSLIDVGYINWKEDVTTYRSDSSFVFEGEQSNGLFSGEGLELDMNQLVDSIANTFEFAEDSASYQTGLPAKMYLTGYYRLARNTKASVTFYGDFIGSFRRGLSVGVSQRLGRWLQAAATYSMQARSYNNLGFGLTVTTGAKGLQLYAVTDNVLAIANPGSAKVANVRTGFNFVF